jgi:hypothetical protein
MEIESSNDGVAQYYISEWIRYLTLIEESDLISEITYAYRYLLWDSSGLIENDGPLKYFLDFYWYHLRPDKTIDSSLVHALEIEAGLPVSDDALITAVAKFKHAIERA